MPLTKNQLDMLYRVALAEFFTSPTGRATYDRAKAIAALTKAQYIRHNGVSLVLTDDGRELLDAKLDRARLDVLRGMRTRRAARLVRMGQV